MHHEGKYCCMKAAEKGCQCTANNHGTNTQATTIEAWVNKLGFLEQDTISVQIIEPVHALGLLPVETRPR
jgi:hypothetical protein